MPNYKAEVILTMNGKAVMPVLEAIKGKAEEIKQKMDGLTKNSAEWKQLNEQFKAFQSAEESIIKSSERLDHAVQNLASTSLQNLKKALGDGRRELAGLSEEQLKEAEEIRKKMKIAGDQIRLLEGQYVKIEEGLERIFEQSDNWLSKAIKQQKELLSTMKPTGDEYKEQLTVLKQLTNEEDRRAGKASISFGAQKNAVRIARTGKYYETDAYGNGIRDDAGNFIEKKASLAEMKYAKQRLTDTRETLTSPSLIKEYTQYIEQLDARIKGLTNTAKMTSAEMKKIWSNPKGASRNDINTVLEELNRRLNTIPVGSKNFERLSAKIKELEAASKGVKDKLVDVNDVLKRSKQGKASVEELKQAYKQLEAELNKIKDLNGSAFKNGQKDLKNLKKQIDEVTGSVNKQGGAWSTAVRNMTAYFGIFQLFSKVKEMLTGFITDNARFSDQLTNIRKVSNMATEDVTRLAENLKKIDTRTTVEELNEIAYAGAKLGVVDLEGFTRAANQVNVALKEDMGEEALTALSKMTEVMGLIPKLGVEESMLRTGSAIFKLASTTTASSNQIVDFSQRMLALGSNASLTTADILALGASVDAMALEPEVAATAFGKLAVELRKGTSDIEHDLGIAEGKLKELIETGHGMDAIMMIFERMHDSENVFALNGLFKDMGSADGARLTKTMVTMAEKVDMLRKNVATANVAFDEGSAVTQEYMMQQQTAQAYMERANNLWHKYFINATNANGPVKEITKSWYEMTQALIGAGDATGGFTIAIKAFVAAIKLGIELMPMFVAALMTKGLGAAFMKLGPIISNTWTILVAGARSVIPALGAASNATGGLTAKWKTLNATMKANVIALVVGAVIEAIYWFSEWNDELSDMEKLMNTQKNLHRDAIEAVAEETLRVESLVAVFHDEHAAMEDRIKAMNMLNSIIPGYNAQLDTTTGKYKESTSALRQYNNELIRNAEIEAAKGKLTEISGKILELRGEKFEEQKKLSMMTAPQGIKGRAVGGALVSLPNLLFGGIGSFGTSMMGQMGRGGYDYYQQKSRVDNLTKQINALTATRKWIEDEFGDEIKASYIASPTAPENPVGNGSGGGKSSHTGKSGRTGRHGGGDPNKQAEKVAKDRANALLANIEAFYAEQERKYYEWVAKMNENGERVSEGQIKRHIEELNEARLKAEGLARQSIATAGEEWDKFKGQLAKDQFQSATETDTRLLAAIEKSNIKELHDLFEKLGMNLAKENNKTLSENLGALLDEIFKNGAKNLTEAAERFVKRQQEIQDILNEHDYTGTVDRNARSKFDELRFLHPASGINANTEAGQQKMMDSFDALTKKARESVVELFKIDIEAEDFETKFRDYLAVAGEGFDFSKVKGQDLKALYIELIKYTDEYTEAEKRATDRRRKIIDREWSVEDRNVSTQQTIKEVGWRNDLRGKQPTLSESFGFYDIADDPEIKLYEYRKIAARDYYDFVKARTNDAILIREAEQKVLEATIEQVKKEWSAIQERVNAINGFMQPTYDAIEEMGNVWAKFNESAESGQQAMLDNLRNFIKQYAVMMIKGLRDQAERKVKGAILVKNTAEKNGMDVDELREASKQKKFRKKKVYNEDVSFNGKMNDDGTLDQEALKNTKSVNGIVNAVGEDQQNPLNPAEAAAEAHQLEIDELREFHRRMLEETKLYLEMMQKLQENPEQREQIVSEYEDRIAQESKYAKEQADIRRKSFDALKKVGVAGWNALLKQEGDAQQQKTDLATTAEEGITDTEKKNQDERAQQSAQASAQSIDQMVNETIGKVVLGIAGGSAKTVSELGWWGIPLVGVISAALMGLLNYALSFIGKGSNGEGGGAKPNTKLVSGMLTYDNGNIQDLKPFMGEDGNIYYATEDNTAHRGVNLLTKPTATTINGQPSLVAENGPELVIGRKTTAAMMQNNPALLKAIYQFDRNHSSRALYDAGNLASSPLGSVASQATTDGSQVLQRDEQMYALMAAILERLNNPIAPEINMYGTNGLHRKIQQANAFMKGK